MKIKIQFLSHTSHISNAPLPLLVATVLNGIDIEHFFIIAKILSQSADCISWDFLPQSR